MAKDTQDAIAKKLRLPLVKKTRTKEKKSLTLMREINISLFCVERRDNGRNVPNFQLVNPLQLLLTNCLHFRFPLGFPEIAAGTQPALIWPSH
jgi:hypothetical protein